MEFNFDQVAPEKPRVNPDSRPKNFVEFLEVLRSFRNFGTTTQEIESTLLPNHTTRPIPVFINEFWTSKQRAANALHEIAYRACFKPQLPRFFIELLTPPQGIVYDPFAGRGTTAIEAALLGRIPWSCDVSPVSQVFTLPRLAPPQLNEIAARLHEIPFHWNDEFPEDLLVFYHPDTLREICALRHYLQLRKQRQQFDPVDAWIEMVAVNRLTGHSSGFFSVYTLPPNQAVSVRSQKRINQQRNQTPPRRLVPDIILKKSRSLLKELSSQDRQRLAQAAQESRHLNRLAHQTNELPSESVDLVVTSPPFLNVVDYAGDNWLRSWFLQIDPSTIPITIAANVEKWRAAMTAVLAELKRLLKPDGCIAFEVGEVRSGNVLLEETVLQAGMDAGLTPLCVMINRQVFTKTANCWGVNNNLRGTNTNRISLLRK